MSRAFLIVLSVAATACHPRASMDSREAPPLAADAVAGVTAPPLRDLLAEHWEWTMRASPEWATQLGDHRFDDQLSARDAATIARLSDETRAFLARARGLDASGFDERDRVTLELFVGELEAAVATDVCHDEQWHVSINENPYSELASLVEQTKLRGPEDHANLVKRLAQTPTMVDDTIANLETGLAAGRVTTVEGARRTLAMIDAELARPTREWSMAEPGGDDLLEVLETTVRPAIQRYRDVLADRILPAARSGADEGIGALPDGDACYRATILDHLGMARTPEELHQLGLDEIARIDEELAALGAKVLGTTDLASTIERLRTDRTLYFETADELVAASQEDLDQARAAIPQWFGRLPETECVMAVIPEHDAPYTTIAYYQPPHPDGSKPGEFYINTYRPETRPRFELAALAAHESIPGHHLQIAIAQELGEVPAFRKYGGSTAYVEGWALYTERLAEEMGLYETDLDRIGMLSYDAWRASRLVVDTGLHAMRWTRAQAEAFMLEHTALTPENVTNEVDRYISWPGQALAYKVGQLEILALRADAERRLGDRFDIKAFHDVVLGQGAVTLPILRAQVEAWVKRSAGSQHRVE